MMSRLRTHIINSSIWFSLKKRN